MAIERDDKFLNGAGLERYTELLKLKLEADKSAVNEAIDGITTSISNISTTINNIIGDASSSGDSLGELEDRIETMESQINDTEAEDGDSGILERLDNLEDATNNLSDELYNVNNNIDNIEDDIDGITETITGLTTVYKKLQSERTITVNPGSYISSIRQDEQGIISATSAILPSATTDSEGLVQMASGATTNVVYDKNQIDNLIAGVDGDISGLTTTYKQLQQAVSNPSAAGTSYSFISGITQNAQGVIVPTAATLPTASTSGLGLVQMVSGATTTRVYDANQVDDLINQASAAAFVAAITTTLPATGDENTIYFVANGTGTTPNFYIEYMYVNGNWEVVGNTELAIETLSNNEVEGIFNDVFSPLG